MAFDRIACTHPRTAFWTVTALYAALGLVVRNATADQRQRGVDLVDVLTRDAEDAGDRAIRELEAEIPETDGARRDAEHRLYDEALTAGEKGNLALALTALLRDVEALAAGTIDPELDDLVVLEKHQERRTGTHG